MKSTALGGIEVISFLRKSLPVSGIVDQGRPVGVLPCAAALPRERTRAVEAQLFAALSPPIGFDLVPGDHLRSPGRPENRVTQRMFGESAAS
jgi:hypothetical protein